MLSFDLNSLESHAALVDGELSANDPVWSEGDTRPKAGVQVTGRLSAAGAGKYYFSGHFRGTTASSCRRCLEAVTNDVAESVHLLFVEAGADEADEPDVYVVDPRQRALDLREAVREEWLLAVPPFSLCRDECRGLCPRCGANLNQSPCGCPPSRDSRWDALSSLKDAGR